MQSLARNHPFVDGSKRVAFALTAIFLRMNGLRLVEGALHCATGRGLLRQRNRFGGRKSPFDWLAFYLHSQSDMTLEDIETAATSHILLAEDDDDLRGLFAKSLRRRGYRVTNAADGREALAICTGISRGAIPVPDAIVMDIRMPHFSGLELLRAIKRAEWEIPIILMTGFGDVPTHVRAYELGAYDVLNKPLSTSRLASAIEDALTSFKASQSLRKDRIGQASCTAWTDQCPTPASPPSCSREPLP